jgi:hypothetical protein
LKYFTNDTSNDIIKEDAGNDDTERVTMENGVHVPKNKKTGDLGGPVGEAVEASESESGSDKPAVKGYSASGANPDIPSFTKKALDRHWGGGGKSDHSKQYPGFDRDGYAQRALELAQMPIGEDIDGYKTPDGSIVRYDKVNNDFVKAYLNGISSMYKPKGEEEYFKRAMKREGGTRND